MSGSYNEQEAQEILRRASQVQTSGFMSRDELVRAAGELGITPEAVDAAERDYREAQEEENLKAQFRSKRKSEFVGSLKSMAAYAGFVWFIYFYARDLAWLGILLGVFAVLGLTKNTYLAFAEKSDTWKREFENFKETEGRRKSLSTRRANDRIISDILMSTPANEKIHVIKNLRDATGLGLAEAKSAVDDYYGRHPEVLRQSS